MSWFVPMGSSIASDDEYSDQLNNRISNYETRLGAIGEELPKEKKKKSLLISTLETLDRPRNAIVNAIQDSSTGENGFLQGLGEGFSRKEEAHVSDMLSPSMNKYARAGLGFVGDVLLDPLTYLTVGTGGVAKTALKEGAEAVAENAAKKSLRFMGQEIADVTPITKRANAIWDATGLPEVFSTKAIKGASQMSPDELARMKQGVGLTNNWGQRVKGQQSIAMHDVLNRFGDTTDEAAMQIPGLIEAPKELARQQLLKANPARAKGMSVSKDILSPNPLRIKKPTMEEAATKLGMEFTPEGLRAAEIAKQITSETSLKDIQAGVDFGMVPDYIKHLYDDTEGVQKAWQDFQREINSNMNPNKKMSFQKERKFSTFDEFREYAEKRGLKMKPIEDGRVLVAVREMEGVYKREAQKMMGELENLGLAHRVTGTDTLPAEAKNWVKIRGGKDGESLAVHPEIARHLNRAMGIAGSPQEQNVLGNVLNSVQNVWKGLVTTSVPFHVRNALGNVYNNWLAGVVNPSLYKMAGDIQRGVQNSYKVGNNLFTSDELMNMFRQQGLEGFGIFEGEATKTLTKEAQEAVANNSLGKKLTNIVAHPVKTSRKVGDSIETNAKLAHFIDRLQKGDSPEQAAESVRKYLFDYSDLTPTEQKIKAVMPFYTWTRKNLPLQLENLITQPGKQTAAYKLMENAQASLGTKDSDTPDWMKDEMAIPILINKDGTQTYLMPDFPVTNLNMFGGGNTLRNFLGMVSPLAKVPIEIAMNQQIFSGSPIEKYEGAESSIGGVKMPAKLAYALSQLGPMPRSAMNVAGNLLPQDVQGESKIPLAPQQGMAKEFFLGSLARNVNPERQNILNLLERSNQLGDYVQKLEEVDGKEVPSIDELTPKKFKAWTPDYNKKKKKSIPTVGSSL